MNKPSRGIRFTLISVFVSVALAAKGDVTLTLDCENRQQTIEGFGTCIIDWVPKIAEVYRQEWFQKFYLDELGATVIRIPLGEACPEKENWEEIHYSDFAIPEPARVGPELAEKLSVRYPGLKVIASVWSPPAWMKVNGLKTNGGPRNIGLQVGTAGELGLWAAPLPNDPTGERFRYVGRNKLRHDRYLHFARLLVEWTRFFRAKGLDLYAISPQNELRFSQTYNSCVYTPTEYAEVLRVIDWMFHHEGVKKPIIFGPEDMSRATSENLMYFEKIFVKSDSPQLLDVLACHGYVDGVTMDARPESASAFAQFGEKYKKPVWMTEGGTGAHGWPEALDQIGTMMMASLTVGRASLVAPWQVLDSKENTHALMGLNGPTKKTFTAMQYWRFIRPGMVRIGASGATDKLMAAAFADSGSKKIVLVVLNRNSSAETLRVRENRGDTLRVNESYVTDATHNCAKVSEQPATNEGIQIPGQSVVTLLLSQGH